MHFSPYKPLTQISAADADLDRRPSVTDQDPSALPERIAPITVSPVICDVCLHAKGFLAFVHAWTPGQLLDIDLWPGLLLVSRSPRYLQSKRRCQLWSKRLCCDAACRLSCMPACGVLRVAIQSDNYIPYGHHNSSLHVTSLQRL